jgi:2-polyprenyl-3-methyl-5-hydroxy-6-metoxy-1,4-benzoquinol methylase
MNHFERNNFQEDLMNKRPMDLYGKALKDYFNGEHEALMILHRDDGFRTELPAHVFFSEPPEFSKIGQLALELCSGRVLDIGAGSGRHSLALQENGMDVYAIDIAPQAVEIMRKAGVRNAKCHDIYEYRDGKFDTLLLLGHGIGMTGTLGGLRNFLDHAHTLLNPQGKLVFDSLDVRCTTDPGNQAYQERNKAMGRYFGEIHLQFEYKGQMGEPWTWLQVDPGTLADEAGKAGWTCKIVHRELAGDYLAVLTNCEM